MPGHSQTPKYAPSRSGLTRGALSRCSASGSEFWTIRLRPKPQLCSPTLSVLVRVCSSHPLRHTSCEVFTNCCSASCRKRVRRKVSQHLDQTIFDTGIGEIDTMPSVHLLFS